MGKILISNKEVKKCFVGNKEIRKIYYGSNLIYVNYIYTITTNVVGGTFYGDDGVKDGQTTATVTLSAKEDFSLPSSITVSGASYTYNSTTGVVSLSNFTDNVTISVTCNYLGNPYLTFSSPDTFSLNVVDNQKYWDGILETSTDATNWSTWTGTSVVSSASDGTKHNLYVRGTGNTYITGSSASSSLGAWRLNGSNISVSGNIENLLDYATVVLGNHPAMAISCYRTLFAHPSSSPNSSIIDASNLQLPATTLGDSCYRFMFQNCTSLTTAPSLPATTLASYCYYAMFINCTSLTTAPALPATTLASYCYAYMFQNCTSLTTAPVLPATTLADYCYWYMFENCTSLTTAPSLPATTLAYYCYRSMFENCTSLTTAPSLPATTLAYYCYDSMFSGCTSLTTAPALPATTLASYCYLDMFYGCTSLTTAPNLPATTLADYCYNGMFYNCTSLTTAPNLPATTLASNCYQTMFYGCTSLTTPAKMAGGTTQAASSKNCCTQMYSGCSALKIYTSSSGHTAFYKAITYSTSSSGTNYRSSFNMFYNCYIDGVQSTTTYLDAGTQYYY